MEKALEIVVYGAESCADCHRVRAQLDKNTVAYTYKDTDDAVHHQQLLELTNGKEEIPVLTRGEEILENPSNDALLDWLAIEREDLAARHEVVMIGAGPASLSAAIYTTREDIETMLFERGAVGGLAAITDMVDNYPGFPDGIEGLTLAENLRKQAERFGAVIELGEVTKINDEGTYKRLETTSGNIWSRVVLIATGSDYKKVGVPGEQEYYARGVHYCATCDGAFYRDKRLVVIGGGNSAVQEALFLTRFASHIDLLVRSSLKASEVLQHELTKAVQSGKISVHLETTTDEIVGQDQKVVKVIGTDKKLGEKKEFATDGVFVFVGLKPNSEFLVGSAIELDDIGFVKTDNHLQTTMSGVFAAGDIRSGATMQIATAVGEGATVALAIREYLEGKLGSADTDILKAS